MKCSLGISNFLEEISRFSHSIVLLYFFALITEEGFLICSCYSLELCIQSSSTLDTSCKELTHWKRLWCWEGLGAGGEGDDRGWDGWMASRTRWMWVWVSSRRWWWTGRPGVLQCMGLQRVRHDWATELNWTEHVQGLDLVPSHSLLSVAFYGVWSLLVSGGTVLMTGYSV